MSRTAAQTVPDSDPGEGAYGPYLEMLALIERLHRLLLDVIKDEFERLQIFELNAVQGLLLFNIGDRVMTAGELRSRGYYQGSNVSYNLKKLVESGFIHQRRSSADRRAVRLQLTEKGRRVHHILADLFGAQAGELVRQLRGQEIEDINGELRTVERFWSETIRYAY